MEATCQAFGPGLPPQGERAVLEVRARVLTVVFASGRREDIPMSYLRARAGGWSGDALQLEWGELDRPFVVSIRDPILIRALEAQLGLRTAGVRVERARIPRAAFITTVAIVMTAAAAVILLVAQSGPLVDLAVRRIPVEWETRLGEQSLPAILAGAKEVHDGEVRRTVQELGDRLAAEVESPYTFTWHVAQSKQVNALALPGGHVVVFTGLVAMTETPEELAGVLAHEIQHVVGRHSLRAMVRGMGLRALLGLVLGGAGEAGSTVVGLVEHLGGLRFSREQEERADRDGLALLQRCGIAGGGMADFFERLARTTGDVPAFLSTHPESSDRAHRIRALLAASPATTPLPYDWKQIRDAASQSPAVTRGW